ncbi:hypothetical protein ACRERI_08065 [Methanothermobacter thermautotrophicus]|uniref:hypothetical protein n=1 Tax=Methanothermobacter thermautotrophicus TaxID=145262 RepID=UPI003D7F8A74
MSEIAEYLDKIYRNISGPFRDQNIYVQNREGITSIRLYDETDLHDGERSHWVGTSHIMIFDDEEPFLAIEAKTSSTPKEIAGPIPLYALTRIVKINGKPYDVESPFLLLITVPDQPREGQKSEQLSDLENKLKDIIDLESKYSNLKDFAICEISDLKKTLKELLENNGYRNYADNF